MASKAPEVTKEARAQREPWRVVVAIGDTRDRSRMIVTDQVRSDPAAKTELVRVKAKLITDVH
ncbi:hypothetical protein [Burkholderia ubonensis]|uniref:hypothetical protein n=1 Tax=Burkholderia ubonensis TaxID=101571 RepID=UPI000AE809F1|nr:hypothetical protein [Burkholderia ubonensis]